MYKAITFPSAICTGYACNTCNLCRSSCKCKGKIQKRCEEQANSLRSTTRKHKRILAKTQQKGATFAVPKQLPPQYSEGYQSRPPSINYSRVQVHQCNQNTCESKTPHLLHSQIANCKHYENWCKCVLYHIPKFGYTRLQTCTANAVSTYRQELETSTQHTLAYVALRTNLFLL